MAENMNANYGRLESGGMVTGGAAGITLVVCPVANPAYDRLSQIFKSDDGSFTRFFNTVQGAVDALVLMDVVTGNGTNILVAPGSYNESVTIPFSVNNVTIRGLGGRGSAGIDVSGTAGAEGLLVNANDVTLINFGVAANTTGLYALKVTGSRFRAYQCKFEGADTSGSTVIVGPGTVAQVAALTAGRGGDMMFIDDEFCWGFNGLATTATDFGQATEILVKDCLFHDLSNIHIITVPGAFGIGSVGGLWVEESSFELDEAGNAPSDFVKVDDAADTGMFTLNSFAIATNAAADLKIGALVMWVANYTEAGTSAARPA